MNEIKIYLNPSGSTAEVYKDFNLYQGSYRNTQITLYVPTEILYENADGTYLNVVKTGAILTAPNGAKVTTKSFNAEYVKTVSYNNVEYAIYTQVMPKEYALYTGTQVIVCNILSIDNTNASAPQILSVVTSQVVPLLVLASAYLDNDEPLDPTEAEVIEGLINSLQKRLTDGEYATRALYAWSPDYTYGANELVSYPQKGQYGAIIKSLVADNKQNPYVNGEINAQYWVEIIDFNILNGLYGLQTQIEDALTQSQANANAAESAMADAQVSATAAQEAAESIKASADYLESLKGGTVAVPRAISDGTGKNIAEHFTDIESLIPSTTTAENQLANEAFVNSSINNMAAFYITYNAGGDAFPTRASLLNATTYYYGGQARTPTQNDYAIVLADESQPKGVDGNYPTTRYSYQGGNWAFQYVVNNTSLTQAQVNAINSGISAAKIESMDAATAAKYTKPSSGILESDLSQAVQIKLNENGADPSNTAPLADGTASAGTSEQYARGDHRHPIGQASQLQTARAIDGVNFDGTANITHFATCSTAASTAAKTVTLASFSLVAGARISIKFTNANTVNSSTLNVNGTGAKTIKADGDTTYVKWLAGSVMDFVYDGSNWVVLSGYQLVGMRIGFIYQSTENVSPTTLYGGTWAAISAGYYLKSVTSGAGTYGSAGLPNITGDVGGAVLMNGQVSSLGAFSYTQQDANGPRNDGSLSCKTYKVSFDASKESSIYGNSTTVTPNNYGVYMWRRTA